MATREITQTVTSTVKICDICGSKNGNYRAENDDKDYCHICYHRAYRTCDFCEKELPITSLAVSDYDVAYCKACASDLVEIMIDTFGVSFIPTPKGPK